MEFAIVVLWVIVDFDDISLQKYGQFIIQSLSCSSVKFPIGGLQNCAKFIGTWHLLWLLVFPVKLIVNNFLEMKFYLKIY